MEAVVLLLILIWLAISGGEAVDELKKIRRIKAAQMPKTSECDSLRVELARGDTSVESDCQFKKRIRRELMEKNEKP